MVLIRKSTLSLHFEKHKTASRGLQRHNERKSSDGIKHSNKNIDLSKTEKNIFLKVDDRTYAQRCSDIIKKSYTGNKKIRKDAVKMISATVQLGGDLGSCISGDNKKATEEEQVSVLLECYEWLKERYGEDNIVSAVIHLDETTPHLHFDFVPMVNGKLSAKEVLGNKQQLTILHKELWRDMNVRCPGWGFSKNERTLRNGISQKLFEELTSVNFEYEKKLDEQSEELDKFEEFLDNRARELDERERSLYVRDKMISKKELEFNSKVKDFNEKIKIADRSIKMRNSSLNVKEELLNAKENEYIKKECELDRMCEEASERLRRARRAEYIAEESLKKSEVAENALNDKMILFDKIKEKAINAVRNLPVLSGLLINWAEKQPYERVEASQRVVKVVRDEIIKPVSEAAQRGSIDVLAAKEPLTHIKEVDFEMLRDCIDFTSDDFSRALEEIAESYEDENFLSL